MFNITQVWPHNTHNTQVWGYLGPNLAAFGFFDLLLAALFNYWLKPGRLPTHRPAGQPPLVFVMIHPPTLPSTLPIFDEVELVRKVKHIKHQPVADKVESHRLEHHRAAYDHPPR